MNMRKMLMEVLMLMAAVTVARAQAVLVEAPAGIEQPAMKPGATDRQPEHNLRPFLDKRNTISIFSSALAISGDLYTTQLGLSKPGIHELNPVARPFTGSKAGTVVYGLGCLGAEIGGMYLAHRKGWRRLERWIPVVVTVTESLYIRNNIATYKRASSF
jgi:hypothetical protein